jgi:hypothetical protein
MSAADPQDYCLCRHCRPPFKLNDQDKPPTPFDLLVVMQELGIELLTDGVVMFIYFGSDEVMRSLPKSYFATVKSHRAWFLKHLKKVSTAALRQMFGDADVDAAVALLAKNETPV